MSLGLTRNEFGMVDPLERVEEALEDGGWQAERDEEGTIQAVAETRWGDLGALFAYRPDPAAIHFSMTLDVKPQGAKRSAIAELIMMANERLWLGHFDLWTQEGLVMFRHGLLLNGAIATPHQCEALLSAALEACERYYQAFQFVVWAGKESREALVSTMFETEGQA